MGKGKGKIDRYVAVVRAGHVLFELSGRVTDAAAAKALSRASVKLAVSTKVVRSFRSF